MLDKVWLSSVIEPKSVLLNQNSVSSYNEKDKSNVNSVENKDLKNNERYVNINENVVFTGGSYDTIGRARINTKWWIFKVNGDWQNYKIRNSDKDLYFVIPSDTILDNIKLHNRENSIFFVDKSLDIKNSNFTSAGIVFYNKWEINIENSENNLKQINVEWWKLKIKNSIFGGNMNINLQNVDSLESSNSKYTVGIGDIKIKWKDLSNFKFNNDIISSSIWDIELNLIGNGKGEFSNWTKIKSAIWNIDIKVDNYKSIEIKNISIKDSIWNITIKWWEGLGEINYEGNNIKVAIGDITIFANSKVYMSNQIIETGIWDINLHFKTSNAEIIWSKIETSIWNINLTLEKSENINISDVDFNSDIWQLNININKSKNINLKKIFINTSTQIILDNSSLSLNNLNLKKDVKVILNWESILDLTNMWFSKENKENLENLQIIVNGNAKIIWVSDDIVNDLKIIINSGQNIKEVVIDDRTSSQEKNVDNSNEENIENKIGSWDVSVISNNDNKVSKEKDKEKENIDNSRSVVTPENKQKTNSQIKQHQSDNKNASIVKSVNVISEKSEKPQVQDGVSRNFTKVKNVLLEKISDNLWKNLDQVLTKIGMDIDPKMFKLLEQKRSISYLAKHLPKIENWVSAGTPGKDKNKIIIGSHSKLNELDDNLDLKKMQEVIKESLENDIKNLIEIKFDKVKNQKEISIREKDENTLIEDIKNWFKNLFKKEEWDNNKHMLAEEVYKKISLLDKTVRWELNDLFKGNFFEELI